MMTLGLRQIQTWKKVAQEDSTEEDDEETDALHVWGGLECGLKNDWVSNFVNSDNLRSLEGSDDERKSERNLTIIR